MSATVKLEANMDAVILWQSVQLQTKELTRPGPWVGWELGGCVKIGEMNEFNGRDKVVRTCGKDGRGPLGPTRWSHIR